MGSTCECCISFVWEVCVARAVDAHTSLKVMPRPYADFTCAAANSSCGCCSAYWALCIIIALVNDAGSWLLVLDSELHDVLPLVS